MIEPLLLRAIDREGTAAAGINQTWLILGRRRAAWRMEAAAQAMRHGLRLVEVAQLPSRRGRCGGEAAEAAWSRTRTQRRWRRAEMAWRAAPRAGGVGRRGGASCWRRGAGFTKPTGPVKPPPSDSGLPDRFDQKPVEFKSKFKSTCVTGSDRYTDRFDRFTGPV